MIKLIVDKDDSEGNPFIADDFNEEKRQSYEVMTYIRIRNKKENYNDFRCIECNKFIEKGWRSVDDESLSYCDNHVEILE